MSLTDPIVRCEALNTSTGIYRGPADPAGLSSGVSVSLTQNKTSSLMTYPGFLFSALCTLLSAQTIAQAPADNDQWQLLDQYCTGCHNLDDYSGGLAFDLLSPASIPQD